MRKFLFCVCVILVLTSATLLIFQSGIEQAIANQAASEVGTAMNTEIRESLNEMKFQDDTEKTIHESALDLDDEERNGDEAFDSSQFCHPPHTKDGIGGAGGFIVDDPQCLELLARAIYAEAGGDDCSDETRIMVGNVILNRMRCEWYPDTMEAVLTQKRQYNTFYWTGVIWIERALNPSEKDAVERAYKCAERVLLGERLLPEDVVFQSEYIQGTEIVAHQDGIYFCR